MLKENEFVGSITILRQEVRPFTDKQIALVQNFAAQAVIAIENTRLLNELRQRTDDLTESLEQQTATSEVLRVISSSPGELEPVFQSMLENATRICEAKFGNLLLYDGDAFRLTAVYGAPPAWAGSIAATRYFVQPQTSPLGVSPPQKGWSTSPTLRANRVTQPAIRRLCRLSMSQARAALSSCQCLRKMS